MNTSKRVVLVKAPCLEAYENLNTNNHFLSLGPLYLHSYLQKHNIPTLFIDPEAEGLSSDRLIDIISENSPVLIGLSCYTSHYLQAKALSRLLKKRFNDIPIVLGGPHASATPKLILEKDGDLFDFLVIGEGEKTLVELFHALVGGDDISRVDGLAYRLNGDIVFTEPRHFIEDLDELPFPSWDQINFSNYLPQANFNKRLASATLITSRGCPFKCDFCQSKNSMGRKIRFHSAEYVVSQIEELYHHYGIRYFRFVDDVFTVNHTRLQQIVSEIKRRNLRIKFWCMARANMIKEETLLLLKDGGLESISIGVESGNNAILREIGKGIIKEDARKTFLLFAKHGIESQGFFMIGFYHDTYETIMQTISFAIELDPVFATFTVLVPYPGTSVFKKHYQNRIDFDDDMVWNHFTGLGSNLPGFGNALYSREELRDFLTLAYRRFYFRLKKIIRLALKIKGKDQLWEYIKDGCFVIQSVNQNLDDKLIKRHYSNNQVN